MVTVRTPSEIFDEPNAQMESLIGSYPVALATLIGQWRGRFDRSCLSTARLSLLTMECPLLGDYGR
jgi:hypothetical protein